MRLMMPVLLQSSPMARMAFSSPPAMSTNWPCGSASYWTTHCSGGGSALIASPVEGVTLPDLQFLTSYLLACGARVDEINILRRHLDMLKGGGKFVVDFEKASAGGLHQGHAVD